VVWWRLADFWRCAKKGEVLDLLCSSVTVDCGGLTRQRFRVKSKIVECGAGLLPPEAIVQYRFPKRDPNARDLKGELADVTFAQSLVVLGPRANSPVQACEVFETNM
jgi:hypothetical protein